MEKIMYPTSQLFLEIVKTLEKEINNKELMRHINENLTKKGLSTIVVQQLINDMITHKEVTDYEYIAIAEALYSTFNNSMLNPDKYFSNNILINYESYVNMQEKLDRMILKNFIQVTPFKYIGSVTFKEVYEWIHNNLVIYNPESQRASKYRRAGDHYIRDISIDKKAIESIKDLIQRNKLYTSEVCLNCQVIKGKNAQFKFENKFENFGDIIFKPEYDKQEDSYGFMSVVDGYHRIMSIAESVENHFSQTGEWLEGTLEVKVLRETVENAREYTMQSFQRSEAGVSDEWIQSLSSNPMNNFADQIIKQSNLKNNVANTYEEYKMFDKLTVKSYIVDALKRTNVDVDSASEVMFTSRDIAKNMNIILDILEKENCENTAYNVAAYTYVAYKLINDTDKILDVIVKLENSEEFKRYNKKNMSMNKLIDYVNVTIEGEIKNG